MSTIIRYIFVCVLSVLSLFAAPAAVHAATAAQKCDSTFLGFPAWYRGLATGETCRDIKPPSDVGGISNFLWVIVLNLVELLLRLTAYAATALIIYGGYKYMISAGSADGMVAARKTILNAVIGLVISIAAVAIVRSISTGIGLGN